jgi:streptogramin lyase
MNALRAVPFTPASSRPLHAVAGWPRLPASFELDRVIGVAVNSKGLIFVAHRGENPLFCLHPDGSFAGDFALGAMQKTTAYDLRGPVPVPIATRYWLHGLHLDPWDNVWVSDVGRHLVMKFDPSGKLLMTLGVDGKSGDDDQHFGQPTHVCVVPSGEFFVTDGYGNSRIVKFSATGEYLMEWGTRGTAPGEFHTPHVIVLGPDGLLYMTDRENDRIQVFDQAGRVQAEWPDLHSVDGLCYGADGFFYAGAGMDHAVLRLDQNGTLLDVWTVPGAMRYPHAVARSADGAIYAADSGDFWVTTGRLPGEQSLEPRIGAEGSAILKLFPGSIS